MAYVHNEGFKKVTLWIDEKEYKKFRELAQRHGAITFKKFVNDCLIDFNKYFYDTLIDSENVSTVKLFNQFKNLVTDTETDLKDLIQEAVKNEKN